MAIRAIAASDDGHYVAWSEAGKLILVDALRGARVAELAIDLQPPLALALSADPYRLVVVDTRGAGTLVRVLSVPDLEPLAEGTLPAPVRLACVCASTAVLLGTGDTLTLLDLATLHVAALTVRGPIQAVGAWSSSQVLIGARGKLEAWSLEKRRPTHRLTFVLPTQPLAIGVAANGSLLWTASVGGAIACYRLTDGTLVSECAIGARPISITASPTEPMLIAVALPATGDVVSIDLLTGTRSTLATGRPISAACIAGSNAIVLPELGPPVQVPLSGNEPAQRLESVEPAVAEVAGFAKTDADETDADTAVPTPPAPPSPPAPEASQHVENRLHEWRVQVREAVQTSTPQHAGRRSGDVLRSGTRADLVAWADHARTRKLVTPPAPPKLPRLDELAHRHSLDVQSRTLLALLYGAWLDGDGKHGIPVAQAARVIGNDDQAWSDALAQGRLGRLGWVRASYGRIRLRAALGRFLDGAPPGVAIIAPVAGRTRTVEPPVVVSRWAGEGELDTRLRELADACNTLVASIDLDALPPARFDRALDSNLLEARLHGALPVLHAIGAPAIDLARLAEPMLLTSRTAQITWSTLPSWPPPAESQEAAG